MIESLFFIAAAIALFSALLTINSHNAVHALLYLVTMMLSIALIFLLLGSSFAAALQIIIYAGAILVLFVFVTMMMHQGSASITAEKQLFSLVKSKGPLLLSAVLLIEFVIVTSNLDAAIPEVTSGPAAEAKTMTQQDTSVKGVAIELFGTYKMLVALSALMLLSALISAIHIARRQSSGSDRDDPSQKNVPDAVPSVTTEENQA